jgi:hypothetical protein
MRGKSRPALRKLAGRGNGKVFHILILSITNIDLCKLQHAVYFNFRNSMVDTCILCFGYGQGQRIYFSAF